jgi:ribosome-associated translation inhibitor RaiA
MEGKSRAEVRAKINELSETEDAGISTALANVLNEFFKNLKKCKTRREELRKELRAHPGFMPN